MANIFLSYAHGDRRRAEKVAQALERAGHSVWWDQQIHAGSRFSKDIDTALRKADIVDPANALRMIREGEAPPESDEGLYVEARISPTPSNLEAVLTHYRKVYKGAGIFLRVHPGARHVRQGRRGLSGVRDPQLKYDCRREAVKYSNAAQ